MGDQLEIFAEMSKLSKSKRARNRAQSAELLRSHAIPFTSHNEAAHLIVCNAEHGKVDLWPGTGKWISREGRTGRGVQSLIAFIQGKGKSVMMMESKKHPKKKPVNEWPGRVQKTNAGPIIDDGTCPFV
jgi:hypothetical protein